MKKTTAKVRVARTILSTLALAFLLPLWGPGGFLFAQGDTTIKVTVPYSFSVTRTVTGTRTITTTIPKPKKDTIYIRKRDTIYINTCDHLPDVGKTIKWSEWNGSFQSFIDSAIGGTAIIDKDVTPAATVEIKGSINMIGNGNTITNINPILFLLYPNARQVFQNFHVVQNNTTASAFKRVVSSGTTFYDSLENITVTGGAYAYESSRGGKADSMAITSMRNCIFKTFVIGIGVFSQDGPFRALHLRNVQIKTDTTHNVYCHPSVSLLFDSVASLGAGKLFMHQYTGGMPWLYKTSKYSIFKRVYSNGYMFEMTTPANTPVYIDSSSIAPYVTMGVAPATVEATASEFYNAGNGVALWGTLTNCTGAVWPQAGGTTKIIGGRYWEISMRGGGTLIAENTTINYMSVADRGNDFGGTISNSVFKELQDGRNGNGVFYLYNTAKPLGAYGQAYRPEIIKMVDRQ